MNTEPAITIGAITTAVGTAITLAVAFGVPVTADEKEAILGFCAAVLPIVAAFLIRGKVSPVAAAPQVPNTTNPAA